MKFLTLISLIIFGVQPGLAAEQTMLARVTVYWHGPGKQQLAFSTGGRLRNGQCAVDPKRIPYGSKVIFPDGPCVAVDTGPAVVSRKAARLSGKTFLQRDAIVIDRYFESKKEALAWAASQPHFLIVRVVDSHHKSAAETEVAQTSRETSRELPKTAQATKMSRIQQLLDICSKPESAIAPADIRGPLVPTFLIGCLPGS
jgi:hypothetical protein